MEDFCLDCWNKMNKTNDPPKKYVISKDLDVCEGCGKWRRVILAERKYFYLHKFRYIILPFKIAYAIILLFGRILILPYTIYKRKHAK